MNKKAEIEKAKRDFVCSVSDLLQPNRFSGTSLYKFLLHHRNRLQNSQIDINEVLVEGVKRGLEAIEVNKKAINSPQAWLRVTCLNILRDEVKTIIREEKKSQSLLELIRAGSWIRPELSEQLEYLDIAMSKLSEDDRLLIKLRFFEGKRYVEIQNYLRMLCGLNFSLSSLRKRESRAMKRLRQHFLALYDKETIRLNKSS